MGYKVITPPSAEPLSIEDCRRHLNLTAEGSPATHMDDELVMNLLAAAREHAEDYTERVIAQCTLELALDAFPADEIELDCIPVQAIESVRYIDTNGAEQTLDPSAYVSDTYGAADGDSAWLLPAAGTTWPSTYNTINAVKIRFVAGYSLPGESSPTHPLPKRLHQALLLLLAHWYESREASAIGVSVANLPFGVQALLGPMRLSVGI